MRVRRITKNRKPHFRAALALAGETFNGWAERHHVSRQHLNLVLAGERIGGAELESAITVYIAKHLPEAAA